MSASSGDCVKVKSENPGAIERRRFLTFSARGALLIRPSMNPSATAHSPTLPRWRCVAGPVLGLIGFGAAVATLYATPIEGVTDLGCGVRVLDCSEVLGSRWGKIAGLPVGIFGGAYFAFWIVAIGTWLRSKDGQFLPIATWAMTIGVIASLAFLSLLLFVIKGSCLYCLITHASNLGAAAFLWPLRTWRASSAKAFLTRSIVLAMIAIGFGIGLFQLYQNRVERAEIESREKTIW